MVLRPVNAWQGCANHSLPDKTKNSGWLLLLNSVTAQNHFRPLENVNLHSVISQNKYWVILSLSLYIYIYIRFCDKFQYTIFYGCFLKKHDFLLSHSVQRPKPKFPVQASGNAGIGDEAATSSAKQRLPRLHSSCGIDMGGFVGSRDPKMATQNPNRIPLPHMFLMIQLPMVNLVGWQFLLEQSKKSHEMHGNACIFMNNLHNFYPLAIDYIFKQCFDKSGNIWLQPHQAVSGLGFRSSPILAPWNGEIQSTRLHRRMTYG